MLTEEVIMGSCITNKDYYYLSEVSKMTETPESNLIHAASRGEFNLFIIFKSNIENVTVVPKTNEPLSMIELAPVVLSGFLYEIKTENLRTLKASLLCASDSVKCPALVFGDGKVEYSDIRKRITWENLVVKIDDVINLVEEYNELNADDDIEQSNEQLQAENEALKQRIAELEAMRAKPVAHNQPNESQHLYPCLRPIADIIEAFKHNQDFVNYGQGIKQQTIEEWLKTEYKTPVHEARHIKALITEHYNITTTK